MPVHDLIRIILNRNFLMSKINIDRCAKPVPIHKIHSHPHIRIITKLMCTLDLAVNRLP